jgi:hypothetical protein
MFQAIHGPWCHTRTFPVKCRYCGKAVFYFSCSCGCSVLFEELGDPWPKHYCQEYYQRTSTQIIKIDGAYVERAKEKCKEYQKATYETTRRDPRKNEKLTDIGVVREIIEKVDLYKKYHVETRTILAYKFLGSLKDNDFGQVTIHSGDITVSNAESYTAYIHRDFLEKIKLERHQPVKFTVLSEIVLGDKLIWRCVHLELLV